MALTYGSRGDDVKKLQEAMNKSGSYNLDVDGIYGQKTQDAVKQWQTANGLNADGIAGDDTTNKLYGLDVQQPQQPETDGGGAQQSAAKPSPYTRWNPDEDEDYQGILDAYNQHMGKGAPTVDTSVWDQQMQDIYDKIMNRGQFSYDLGSDPLYQQYRDQYTQQGRMAMMDTMGQAAGLTGGYGSSYGQAAGQQQYNAYLQQLNEIVPDLYGQAYSQYQAEGDALMDQYALAGDMRNNAYSQYQDDYNRYMQELQMLYGMEQDAYNRGMAQDELNYGRQQDLYDKILNQIVTAGYMPSEEELAAAGMSLDEAQKWMALWEGQNGGYGGGVYGGGLGDPGALDDDTEWEPEGVHSSGYTNAEIRRAAQVLLGYSSEDVDKIMDNAATQGITSIDQLIAQYRQMEGTGNETIYPSYDERKNNDSTAETAANYNYATALTQISNMNMADANTVMFKINQIYQQGLIPASSYNTLIKRWNERVEELGGTR